jgi:hypothetical protein
LIGQKVASELCTVVDEGSIPGRRGSLNIDDEGNPTSQTVLIENGILRGLPARQAEHAADRRGAHRQWPPRELSIHADAAL